MSADGSDCKKIKMEKFVPPRLVEKPKNLIDGSDMETKKLKDLKRRQNHDESNVISDDLYHRLRSNPCRLIKKIDNCWNRMRNGEAKRKIVKWKKEED